MTINGLRSDPLTIKQGVPQDSVLGPILFLLFVNNFPLQLSRSSVEIFADDTTITASAHFSDIQSLAQHLNSDLDAVSKWATNNMMFINSTKTKAMSTLYRIARAPAQKPYRIGLLFTKGTLISARFLQRSDAAPLRS